MLQYREANGVTLTITSNEPNGKISQYVYFVQAVGGGPIKIGYAADVPARIDRLQTGSPTPLRVLAVIPGAGRSVETALHHRFRAVRSHGEWFHPVVELTDFIATVGVEDEGLLAGDPAALDAIWRLNSQWRVRARHATRANILMWLGNRRVASALERDRQAAAKLLEFMPDDFVTVEQAVAARLAAIGGGAP